MPPRPHPILCFSPICASVGRHSSSSSCLSDQIMRFRVSIAADWLVMCLKSMIFWAATSGAPIVIPVSPGSSSFGLVT